MSKYERELAKEYRAGRLTWRAAVRALMMETDCDNPFRVSNWFADVVAEYDKESK